MELGKLKFISFCAENLVVQSFNIEFYVDLFPFKNMKHSCNGATSSITKVNSLLPTDTFIMVMKGLMTNRLPSVRRKAMELLNNKLQHKTKWEEQQVRSHAHSLTHSLHTNTPSIAKLYHHLPY